MREWLCAACSQLHSLCTARRPQRHEPEPRCTAGIVVDERHREGGAKMFSLPRELGLNRFNGGSSVFRGANGWLTRRHASFPAAWTGPTSRAGWPPSCRSPDSRTFCKSAATCCRQEDNSSRITSRNISLSIAGSPPGCATATAPPVATSPAPPSPGPPSSTAASSSGGWRARCRGPRGVGAAKPSASRGGAEHRRIRGSWVVDSLATPSLRPSEGCAGGAGALLASCPTGTDDARWRDWVCAGPGVLGMDDCLISLDDRGVAPAPAGGIDRRRQTDCRVVTKLVTWFWDLS
mmetsp:Transcript_57896/g.154706  ORF Transcript_57896/g.154706 Transcript_57896/m.154706 type:complete len:292 (-) Transcript_57896:1065-1940(-)